MSGTARMLGDADGIIRPGDAGAAREFDPYMDPADPAYAANVALGQQLQAALSQLPTIRADRLCVDRACGRILTADELGPRCVPCSATCFYCDRPIPTVSGALLTAAVCASCWQLSPAERRGQRDRQLHAALVRLREAGQ
jgi:hypothetical protein